MINIINDNLTESNEYFYVNMIPALIIRGEVVDLRSPDELRNRITFVTIAVAITILDDDSKLLLCLTSVK